MAKTCRFRWIEGAENYHFTYDDKTVEVEEVPQITYDRRLGREELDELMLRFLKKPEQFVGKSAEIFYGYLTKRGIELPRIKAP